MENRDKKRNLYYILRNISGCSREIGLKEGDIVLDVEYESSCPYVELVNRVGPRGKDETYVVGRRELELLPTVIDPESGERYIQELHEDIGIWDD